MKLQPQLRHLLLVSVCPGPPASGGGKQQPLHQRALLLGHVRHRLCRTLAQSVASQKGWTLDTLEFLGSGDYFSRKKAGPHLSQEELKRACQSPLRMRLEPHPLSISPNDIKPSDVLRAAERGIPQASTKQAPKCQQSHTSTWRRLELRTFFCSGNT
ncbi:hypothetical protein OJAV_G00234960 [Oryzias javanicus]|uniref:Uncharacterized protein n=1 Tax=Oryzias javanicus TaxID=123683 RepID=A0A3S2NNM7_ORYJA|nr:hypothetical protein OJAV_G00234960 [Oryzias javanicus]